MKTQKRWTDQKHNVESALSYELRLKRRQRVAEAREDATTVERGGQEFRLVQLQPESELTPTTAKRGVVRLRKISAVLGGHE